VARICQHRRCWRLSLPAVGRFRGGGLIYINHHSFSSHSVFSVLVHSLLARRGIVSFFFLPTLYLCDFYFFYFLQTISHFHYYTKQELLSLTRLRKYETKLGEKVKVLANGIESLSDHTDATYVCIGIPESIGILGDHGTRGAESTWYHFVPSFLNLQSTYSCPGGEIILAGYFDFNSVATVIEKNHRNTEERINACRHAVANIIDDEVEKLIKEVVAGGKIPVVVGGVHNNAYPIIKASAKALHKKGVIDRPQVNAINLSATADYRIMEGRHSGNPFRYAMEEGYLFRYAVIGLQENVNPQSMMDDLYSNVNIHYHTFEEIFIEERLSFIQSVAQSFSFIDDGHIAL